MSKELINILCLCLVPPSIHADPPDGNFVVKKGKHIELRCKTAGNPPPDIHWTKEVRMRSGVEAAMTVYCREEQPSAVAMWWSTARVWCWPQCPVRMKVSTSAPPAMGWAAQPVPLSSSRFSVSDQNIPRRPNYDRSTNDHPTNIVISLYFRSARDWVGD